MKSVILNRVIIQFFIKDNILFEFLYGFLVGVF